MSTVPLDTEDKHHTALRLYETCGLPGIYLANGYEITRHDDEEYMAVAEVDGLHRAIAKHLVLRRKAFTHGEIRFIRKALDMTQSDLAGKLGVNAQSVARWEKGQFTIPGTAEKLLRAVFLAAELNTDDDLKVLQDLLARMQDELDQADELGLERASFRLDTKWAILDRAA